MEKYLPVHAGLDSSQKGFKILYHNIQGFQNHFEDLKSTEQFKKQIVFVLRRRGLIKLLAYLI